ncbi:MAG: membrane protein insertase YidC [Actinobacteria bacterium]|nr:membrane protein insertase YidC [Actinomycetota bacterium]MBI3687365.1 membrane protein insertase YidC [Actinomycetota bacterium]
MLDPLYTAISWILLRWHDLFSTFLPPTSGLAWALAIMFLVITLRVLLFRFFVKQVKTQRAMQELQPKIQELRQKYKDDRQTLSREMLALQQEAGVSMLAGCLPMLFQAPVFIALFHVLRQIAPGKPALYGWTPEQMASAAAAKLFGAPIPAMFATPVGQLGGGSQTATHIVTVVLIIFMVAATYLTQRMVMARTTGQMEAQQAMIQKLMLYGMPASLMVSGFFFPVGVLLYWFTNNIWTLGQQFYILRRMPVKTPTVVEKKPAVDPKLLAPKPGAKPVNPKARRPATPGRTEQVPAGDGTSVNGASGRGAAGSGEPGPRLDVDPEAGGGAAAAGGGAGGKRNASGGAAARRPPSRPGTRPKKRRR